MENINLQLVDFKCFRDNTFDLNNLTILTGANAAGKSSLIQSLLILDSAVSQGVLNKGSALISLRDEDRALELESAESIIRFDANSSAKIILDRDRFLCDVASLDSPRLLQVIKEEGENEGWPLNLLYLSAERNGPRFQVERVTSRTCGCHGEYTASVIDSFVSSFFKVEEGRLAPNSNSNNFQIQLDAWVDFLFPGLSIKVVPSGIDMFQIRIRNNIVSSLATNIGFGVSYVLPIIVDCLVADKGSWIIIENPEAHLHAKAQSNMGFFLSAMAASGLRIIVETHSEHIVNGIRKSIAGNLCSIKAEDVSLYFLSIQQGEVNNELIEIDRFGNLSSAPVDFFDQQRQDMRELFQLNFGHQ